MEKWSRILFGGICNFGTFSICLINPSLSTWNLHVETIELSTQFGAIIYVKMCITKGVEEYI